MDAKKLLDRNVYSLVVPFVYLHKHTTEDVKHRLKPLLDKHSNVFGNDSLKPNIIKEMLSKRHLNHDSRFTDLMKRYEIADRLRNALAYPKHGNTDIQSLLKAVFKKGKQRDLLPNEPGCRRVIGSAGSGKTFLLIHKAVNAAREEKKVLLVGFNTTMVNNLRDLVTRLARHYAPHCHRNIEVGHFHRFFPYLDKNGEIDNRSMKEQIDVLLIDEGQDFERSWIEKLQKVCAPGYHLMFCEDDRQNIYGKSVKERGAVPGIKGAPNKLNESYRLSQQTAVLANALSTWAKQEGLSGTVKSIKVIQSSIFIRNAWFNGTRGEVVKAIRKDIRTLIEDRNTARADIAILVCTVEDGWQVCKVLKELNLPEPQQSFESEEEHKQLEQLYGHDKQEFSEKLDALRRSYKAGFWMQVGRIKVCTIHSFKGWELSNILVFFNPNQEQNQVKIELLYTAITRSQQYLTVYNADPALSPFGETAISQGFIEQHSYTAKRC